MKNTWNEYNLINAEIDSIFHEAAGRMHMSDSEMNIYYTIYLQGSGCPQSDLYKGTGMAKTTVNSAIRKMEKNGMLYLKKSDGRSTNVYLTDKGREVCDNSAGKIIAMERRMFAGWSEEEKKTFIALNQRIVAALREALKTIEEEK